MDDGCTCSRKCCIVGASASVTSCATKRRLSWVEKNAHPIVPLSDIVAAIIVSLLITVSLSSSAWSWKPLSLSHLAAVCRRMAAVLWKAGDPNTDVLALVI